METKHESIVRFKCHVMNCSFKSSLSKELRKHAKNHENQPFIDCEQEGCNAKVKDISRHTKKIHGKMLTCDQGGCNVKVDDMKNSKMHIAVTYGGGIRYICKSDKFNFETHIKRYLVRHENRCKHSETLNFNGGSTTC